MDINYILITAALITIIMLGVAQYYTNKCLGALQRQIDILANEVFQK